MKHSKALMAAVLLGAFTINANATLTTSANGLGVYDSGLDVTWLQDANLLDTMETAMGYEAMSNAIINANGGVVYDMNGPHTLKGSSNPFYDRDIDEYGYVSWWGAVAFINYLNSINYGGSNQWTLPTANGARDDSSQFGELFYDQGLNVTNYIWNDSLGRYVLDTPFSHNQFNFYWSTESAASNGQTAWSFNTDDFRGGVGTDGTMKQSAFTVWAISPGQLPAAVPVPAAVWLFASALAGLGATVRRKSA